MDPPILGVHNVVAVSAVVGHVKPHLLNLWDAEDVGNPLFVDPYSNGTEAYLLICGWGYCTAVPTNTDALLLHILKELFVICIVVRGAVIKLDTGGAQFL